MFLDLPACDPAEAQFLLLPLPFEGTVSYGKGTAAGPDAILSASAEIETWDEELDAELGQLRLWTADPVSPSRDEAVDSYLDRVREVAGQWKGSPGITIGIGGEHSLTPPLVVAAAGSEDLGDVTVVQFDAHSDLRDTYHDSPHSHACAMRRVAERGATVIAIGIRSADGEEFRWGRESGRVQTYFAHTLARENRAEQQLTAALSELRGRVYLTIDIDALEVCYCPGTGTPQPGGLTWWQTLNYLKALLTNRDVDFIGADVVETVPMPGIQINEFVAAKLVTKLMAYHAFAPGEERI